jgi:hypothetical protein
MAKSHPSVNRRQFAGISASVFAIPAVTLAASHPLLTGPTAPVVDPIFKLLQQHQEAEKASVQAYSVVDAIEAKAPKHVRLEYFAEADFQKLFGHETPAEQARIWRGDKWAVESGLDAAIERNNAARDRFLAIEKQLLQSRPETLGGLAALLDRLAERDDDGWMRLGDEEEDLEVGIFKHLADVVRSIGRAA